MIALMTHVIDALCKALFSDSGQSNYLPLIHIICETVALQTVAQSITRKNLYKIMAKGILLVSFHPKNSRLAIGLYANKYTIFLRSDRGI